LEVSVNDNYEELMRKVLGDLENIERNTPYRLVRGKTHGDWLFVARAVTKDKTLNEPPF
jgi:hypothetical protein